MEAATATKPATERGDRRARRSPTCFPAAARKHGPKRPCSTRTTRPLGLEDLRRGRRDRPQALARADRPRDREGRQGRDPRQHPARVDLLRLRRALRRARPSSRSTRPTRPRSASTCSRTPTRSRSSSRTTSSSRRCAQVRDRCPKLEHVIRMTGESRGRDLDGGARRARRRAAPRPTGRQRWQLGHPRRHLHLHLHLGHHRAAEGLRDLARQLPLDARHGRTRSTCSSEDELTYLFLPLAHSFALLIQLGSFDLGATLAYWERDPLKIVPNLAEVKPTYFPSVPRIFEKIYTAATASVEKEGGLKKAIFDWAIGVGKKVRRARARRASARARPRAPAPDRRQAGAVEDPRPVRRQPASSPSPARRRSTPRSSSSSTPPACSCSRAGG